IGYMLPIEPANADKDAPPLDGPGWKTGPWFLRDDRLFLIPGDSPMGYRLPLDSQPWASKGDYPYLIDRDPTAPRAALPSSSIYRARYAAETTGGPKDDLGEVPYTFGTPPVTAAALRMQGPGSSTATAVGGLNPDPADRSPTRQPRRGESAHWVTRTALCVEVRDPRRANGPAAEKVGAASGVLYVFMPPLARLEDYLDLVAAVEATAAQLGMKIVMEGYPPPRDPRLKMLAVTPDPGVIEVNIHPAHNWKELVDHTEFLYNAAFETRLSAEKFMTDGRHTGTGGGNHFVMGGATPADSPFLRRPELLASLLLYWHNHPSLSYLFSGMFIGPTSQAPRVDEARNDQVYELEIALKEIAKNREIYGQNMPAWLVDRTLRNILIDVSGNTHRSEFCIDKLYSPDSSTGRLGLLELRAFEMPPHARMSIAQQLLIRALVARFWDEPYKAPVTRWGTELHDRFLLPTFVKMDFDDVISEMRQAGFAFDPNWFAPHLEFRFPLVGQVQAMGVELSLRNALEPWHVMGEEGSAGGTVRYVDSSLERIEVRV
ncbi:MAG: IMP dehydrogenase, partial [Comamonadaceae bacterium]